MNSTCTRWSDRYLEAVRRFLPAALASGPAAGRARAENLVMAALPAALVTPLAALFCQLLGYRVLAAGVLHCGLSMLAALMLLSECAQ